MLPIVQLADVLAQVGATDASMALHTHVVTQCQHHLEGGKGGVMREREAGMGE